MIPVLSCWWLDIRNSKLPSSSHKLSFSEHLAVDLGKSVSFVWIKTLNTGEPGIVRAEAQSLNFCLVVTVFMCIWHDLAPELQGSSMGLSHWGLPKTSYDIFFPTTNTTNTIERIKLCFLKTRNFLSLDPTQRQQLFNLSVSEARAVSTDIKYAASKNERGKQMACFSFDFGRCEI